MTPAPSSLGYPMNFCPVAGNQPVIESPLSLPPSLLPSLTLSLSLSPSLPLPLPLPLPLSLSLSPSPTLSSYKNAPEVDEEGYSIRPADAASISQFPDQPSASKSNSDSDSDFDDDGKDNRVVRGGGTCDSDDKDRHVMLMVT